MRRALGVLIVFAAVWRADGAQQGAPLRPPASAPQAPMPQATQPPPGGRSVQPSPSAAAVPAVPPQSAARPAPAAPAPTAQSLGLPIYPAAQHLGTYSAGKGQQYVLFGTTAGFTEIVAYYRTQLDEKGDLVFRDPPTHMFEVGRFREETMAFPPGVTVKDFTWGGMQGYPNPLPQGQPARFATVIMLVPQPTAAPPAVPPPATR